MVVGDGQKFDALIDVFSGPVFVIDRDGEYLEVIGGADERDRMYAEPDTLQGERIQDLLPEDVAAEFLSTVRSVLATATPEVIEYELAVPAGERWFEASIAPIQSPDGPSDAVIWAARDITQRKQREQALTALHETSIELLTSDSTTAICERTIEAAESILSFDQSLIALEEDGLLRVVATSKQLPENATSTIPIEVGIAGKTYRTGETYRFDDLTEVEAARDPSPYRSGLSLPIGDHGNFQAIAEAPAAFDESDQELAEILVAQTRAALDRLEYESQLERQNDRLDEFAGVVSHDLRNPLNVAVGRLALAQEECDSDHLAAVATALERIDRITEDVLWLAREGRVIGSKEVIEFQDTIEAAWNMVDDRTGRAELHYAEDELSTVRIEADDDRLRQLLENLLRNAIEHGGETVTVSVGVLDGGFYVEDDGPGIPADTRDDVFTAGYSTDESGTGFGLSIVQRIAEAHEWDIRVAEGADGGARFEITGVEFVAE